MQASNDAWPVMLSMTSSPARCHSCVVLVLSFQQKLRGFPVDLRMCTTAAGARTQVCVLRAKFCLCEGTLAM